MLECHTIINQPLTKEERIPPVQASEELKKYQEFRFPDIVKYGPRIQTVLNPISADPNGMTSCLTYLVI